MLSLIGAGDEVPGVAVTYLIWEKNGKSYEYDEDKALDALRAALRIGLKPKIMKTL